MGEWVAGNNSSCSHSPATGQRIAPRGRPWVLDPIQEPSPSFFPHSCPGQPQPCPPTINHHLLPPPLPIRLPATHHHHPRPTRHRSPHRPASSRPTLPSRLPLPQSPPTSTRLPSPRTRPVTSSSPSSLRLLRPKPPRPIPIITG